MDLDPNLVNLIADLISRVGFPIFVALWLLIRSDKIMLELRDAVKELKTYLQNHHN